MIEDAKVDEIVSSFKSQVIKILFFAFLTVVVYLHFNYFNSNIIHTLNKGLS